MRVVKERGRQMISRTTISEQPLRQKAYEVIREQIITLKLEPGQIVYESEFSDMLAMSRTPIREAIRTLVSEELIQVLPQRGMRVALISEKKVEETRFVREVLEVNALRLVRPKWNDATYAPIVATVGSILTSQHESSARGDIEGFLAADEAFHRLILELSGNHTLIGVVTNMRAHLNRVRMLSLRLLQNIDSLIQEHEALVTALNGGDGLLADEMLSHHLRRLNQDLKRVRSHYPSYFTD